MPSFDEIPERKAALSDWISCPFPFHVGKGGTDLKLAVQGRTIGARAFKGIRANRELPAFCRHHESRGHARARQKSEWPDPEDPQERKDRNGLTSSKNLFRKDFEMWSKQPFPCQNGHLPDGLQRGRGWGGAFAIRGREGLRQA